MENKRCIFHIPNHIDMTSKSGSSVRPQKMIQAFRDIGYDVDYVMGYGSERKAAIRTIKKNIRNGVQYDFMYSESSTMPTLLTEKNHLPLYPTLDFGFMKFCKKHGIKIGLFYRDVYWKFPIYKQSVPFLKRIMCYPLFHYDLKQYQKWLDILYLPSNRMKKYVDVSKPYKELPPGCGISGLNPHNGDQNHDGSIKLFYVGGIGELYDLTQLLKAVGELDFVSLTVCCRADEWEERKNHYAPYLCDRVRIIHQSGAGLEPYYAESDICMLFFDSEEYRSFAMPIKLFEYLGYLKPVIATTNTAAGEFVANNKTGWAIPFDAKQLQDLLTEIHQNRQMLNTVTSDLEAALQQNTWQSRAIQVANDLSK